MAFQPITGPVSSPGSGIFPTLVFVQGNDQRTINLDHTPFTVGRKVDKDLVIADPRVSRDHALITSEDGQFCVVDQGSKHGTFVNGERVQRKTLERNDRVEFGVRDVSYVIFHPHHASSNTAREFLSQISGIQISTDTTDLEKLTLFLEAARKLNTTGVLDEILVTLLDATLKLTRAERGYVFMRDEEDNLRLAAGRNSKGEPLLDDKTISHSILDEGDEVQLRVRDHRHQPVARPGRPAQHCGLRSAHRDLYSAAQAAGADHARSQAVAPLENAQPR